MSNSLMFNDGNIWFSKLTPQEKQELTLAVRDFIHDGHNTMSMKDLESSHRAYLHSYAALKGLSTRSEGPRHSRILHLIRPSDFEIFITRNYRLSEKTKRTLLQYRKHVHERIFCVLSNYPSAFVNNTEQEKRETGLIRAPLGVQMIPPPPYNISTQLRKEQQALPIYQYKKEFLRQLGKNRVIIVSGETGSGKSTQVPQYILEEASKHNRPCRIIVTQPRRMAAITLSERVAFERGERSGTTCGYHIRFQCNSTDTTNLIFTTSGFLLRSTLSNTQKLFRETTHIIIDEVHERDMDTDFMLIPFRQLIKTENTKLILMSATMNTTELSNYFYNCPIFTVPGRAHEVKILYLDELLLNSNYKTHSMRQYLKNLDGWPNEGDDDAINGYYSEEWLAEDQQNKFDNAFNAVYQAKTPQIRDNAYNELRSLFERDGFDVNSSYSKTKMTTLMMLCVIDRTDYLKDFLTLKPNLKPKDIYCKTAEYYAHQNRNKEFERILIDYKSPKKSQFKGSKSMEQRMLLQAYENDFDAVTAIDHDLITYLVEKICRKSDKGSIMVFLPGYADIQKQRSLLLANLPRNKCRILLLHSQMNSDDQITATRPLNVRKILLSTNIGQTSITIPDLVYVIDSGKIKLQIYIAETNSSSLETVLISKADANQRAGRAGRTQSGYCYRMYSKEIYDGLQDFCEPEIKRSPLTQICLIAKTLRNDAPIEAYLGASLSPPTPVRVRRAVQLLKTIQAISSDEQVLTLGKYLVKLPVNTHLGKCLLYSIYLGCLEPVLNMVSIATSRDPFQIPSERHLQEHAHRAHKGFAEGMYSDLIGYCKLLQEYGQAAEQRHCAKQFCEKHALSLEAMEVADSTKRQIYHQLKETFKFNISPNRNKNDLNMVRAAIAAGFYPNIVVIDKHTSSLRTIEDQNVYVQRNSCLNPPNGKRGQTYYADIPYDFIVYVKKTERESATSISLNTALSVLTTALMCGNEVISDSGIECLVRPGMAAPTATATEPATSQQQSFEIDPDAEDSFIQNQMIHSKPFIKYDKWLQLGIEELHIGDIMQLRALLKNEFESFLQKAEINSTMTLFPQILQELLLNEKNILIDEYDL